MNFKTIPEDINVDSIKNGIVKFGIDCTGTQMHLGHFIPIKIIKKLKNKGCDIHIILGTFTAMMGDPSGKDEMRPILTESETIKNAENIKKQIIRILGKDNITIHQNHEWFNKMTLPEIMSLISKFTVSHLLSRDSFQKRMENGNSIGMHELIVPILQGLDSVKLKTDVEIGGEDQLFNFVMSRDIQEKMNQKPEICIMFPIINGTDGRKMSKSFDNCIFINDTPKDVFGKVMSIPDNVMFEWFPLFFDFFDKNKHPMELKKDLAEKITDEIWPKKGKEERNEFEKIFQKKELPTNMVEIEALTLLEFVVKLRKCSKNVAKKLIISNSVSVNNKKELDMNLSLLSGDIIKVGKKDFGITI